MDQTPSTPQFLIDACALVDFYTACPEVLMLISRCLGRLLVADVVLAEVAELDSATSAELGMTLVQPTGEQISYAATTRFPGLSFEDKICLILSQALGATCITNDKRLRSSCITARVTTAWGLEVLSWLVDRQVLTPDRAECIATAIHTSNPFITEAVLRLFVQRIRPSGQ